MKTTILKINPRKISPKLIKKAAGVIRAGGLVAFPTETVYGLGADVFNEKAVTKIFEVKGRPLDDPLIVHISGREQLKTLIAHIPAPAKKLMNEFWPGPLTIVFEKKNTVPDVVTAGLGTVAVRMPANRIARALIRSAGTPIAAPSANIFGRTSPVKAEHVMKGLGGKVDVVMDGGRCGVGIESTVVEFAGKKVAILRPGGIPLEAIKKVAGKTAVKRTSGKTPGQHPKHYSPKAKVVIAGNTALQPQEVLKKAKGLAGKKVGILCKKEHKKFYSGYDARVLGPADEPAKCAAELFHAFHEFDKDKVDVIIAEAVDEKGLGFAIMNRLKKAAA